MDGYSLKDNMKMLRREILIRNWLKFMWAQKSSIFTSTTAKYDINKPVIYPAFTGQFSYFLLQTLIESKNHGNYLGKKIEEKLSDALELSAKFLVKTQSSSGIWDHELYIDGEIFWNKETLACIYPAVFLVWWGKETNNESYYKSGLKALDKCNSLHDKNEYYGLYYGTDLSINQSDLVTALAYIKCYCKLFEILEDKNYLLRAEKSAWHVISKMWSNIYDKKGNNITGGLLVTTYKGLGFPVIGGSELCQCFEVFCEISKFDNRFLVFAKALLGFCNRYLIREGRKLLGIYEIIFGNSDNWSAFYSSDFASYASGPFIRGLFLFNNLINNETISN